VTPGSLAATLRRLEDERAEADSRYNDALTALDRALARVPSLPQPPAEYDDSQLPALNDTWDLPSASGAAGLKGRIARLVWRVVAPAIERQRTFNSRVVDHLNRNVAAHREAQAALRDLLSVLRDQFAALGTLQTHLIQFAQQITPYVDTIAAWARRHRSSMRLSTRCRGMRQSAGNRSRLPERGSSSASARSSRRVKRQTRSFERLPRQRSRRR